MASHDFQQLLIRRLQIAQLDCRSVNSWVTSWPEMFSPRTSVAPD
jgi:hypothetical protein